MEKSQNFQFVLMWAGPNLAQMHGLGSAPQRKKKE
jgi:hypothetical protein